MRFSGPYIRRSSERVSRSSRPLLLLAGLLAFLLVVPFVGFAQPTLPTDAVLYVGKSARGRTVLASLYLLPNKRAHLRLLEAPLRADRGETGEGESFELTLISNYLEHPRVLAVTTHGWVFYADTLPDGTLDSRGKGQYQTNEREPIDFMAIGTVVQGGVRFADGSFVVQRMAPFFYREPWNQVTFDLTLDENVKRGLPQHEQVAVVPMETHIESRIVHLTALDRNLISYYTLIETNTDGEHSSRRLTTTYMREDRGSWEEVGDACEAAGRLGWECDEATLRSKVIDDLRRQDAGPVEEGVVNAHTRELLDRFVLTPDGIVFQFDDSQSGPYSAAPFDFEVEVPYSELRD